LDNVFLVEFFKILQVDFPKGLDILFPADYADLRGWFCADMRNLREIFGHLSVNLHWLIFGVRHPPYLLLWIPSASGISLRQLLQLKIKGKLQSYDGLFSKVSIFQNNGLHYEQKTEKTI